MVRGGRLAVTGTGNAIFPAFNAQEAPIRKDKQNHSHYKVQEHPTSNISFARRIGIS